MTMHVCLGFVKWDFSGQCFVLQRFLEMMLDTLSREMWAAGLSVCARAFPRVSVVAVHWRSARSCSKNAMGNTFDLQMKKKHTHTFAHTQTQVCLFPVGMICNWIGVLHWQTSKFWQNASRGQKHKTVFTEDMPFLHCCTFYHSRNTFSSPLRRLC